MVICSLITPGLGIGYGVDIGFRSPRLFSYTSSCIISQDSILTCSLNYTRYKGHRHSIFIHRETTCPSSMRAYSWEINRLRNNISLSGSDFVEKRLET